MKFILLAAAAAAIAAVPANATVVTYTEEVTLDAAHVTTYPSYTQIHLSGAPITLSRGDTIDGTITFANGGRLTVAEKAGAQYEESVGGYLQALSGYGQGQTTFELLGVQGDYIGPASFGSSCSDMCFDTFADLTSSSFSFSGIHFSMLYAYGTDSATFKPFDIEIVNGITSFPGQDSAVPEPGTWALLLAGFGITGAALRRKQRSPAVAA